MPRSAPTPAPNSVARRRKLAAGNWKMNGTAASLAEVKKLKSLIRKDRLAADILICPPATLIERLARMAKGSKVAVGGQDCHAKEQGAFTGDVSAPMLADAGASTVIVGHSERRTLHAERDADVHAKAEAAHRAGLVAIICVGETLDERSAGKADDIVKGQVSRSVPDAATPKNTIIAYEPVWAIGTGKTATAADIEAMHHTIRETLRARFGAAADAFRILYGGSVKASNAAEILHVPGVDGALVGGASLSAAEFYEIIKAATPKRPRSIKAA
ncbi:MAG TPA: triose-phosphate isomerase [Micropepsaceae bacterium]|nr:triose-phosphate isomerase [Micropepsaceae bacterium]HRK70454.1 triose-phosphate isomerase [Micropepsaceae bacterium]